MSAGGKRVADVLKERDAAPKLETRTVGNDQDSMDLLRRALPMLIRLGDFIGNGDIDPNRADSIGARCDLIGDIKAKLGEVPERHCLWCKKDLTDIMGVYVFVDGKPVDALLCVEHGANGANMISQNQYDYWTKRAAYLAGEDLG